MFWGCSKKRSSAAAAETERQILLFTDPGELIQTPLPVLIQTPLPVCFSFIYELLERAHLTYQTKTAVHDALEQIILHLAGRQFGFIIFLLFLSVLIWCKNDVHVLHQNQECSSVRADCRSWLILSRYSWRCEMKTPLSCSWLMLSPEGRSDE